MIEVEDAHRVSPTEREVRQLRVVAALDSGTVEAIGRPHGCSGDPNGRWAPGGVVRAKCLFPSY